MLVTMMTAMYIMVRAIESLGVQLVRPKAPFPYMVSQPLPWQVHSVPHTRRVSRLDEFDSDFRKNSIGVHRKNHASMAIASATLAIPCFLSCSDSSSTATNGTSPAPPLSPIEVDKAAATIQNHYRKFQQKKQKNGK